MREGKQHGGKDVRVREGVVQDQNLDRQLDAFEEFGLERSQVFADKASGKDFKRPQYQRLVRRLRKGDVLVVKSIDRLGRNYDEIIDEWRRITKEKGVHVVVLDMPLLDTRDKPDNITGTFIAELMLSILAGFAEEESKSISSNIKWAIQKKYERGEQWHTTAFGYRWNGETFIVQEDEAIVVRRIFDDFLKDVPIRRIQKWVNENGFPGMSNVGITYMLQNEVYKGDVSCRSISHRIRSTTRASATRVSFRATTWRTTTSRSFPERSGRPCRTRFRKPASTIRPYIGS